MKLLVKNGRKGTGVGAFCKKAIMTAYLKEQEIDLEALAKQANEKLGSKTNARCLRWYINDLEKTGMFKLDAAGIKKEFDIK